MQKLSQGQARRQIGVALIYRRQRGSPGGQAGHGAHQVDHAIATLDVVIQHLHIGARQPVAQSLAIAPKLRTHRGEEEHYLSHTSASGNDPYRQAGRQGPLGLDPQSLVSTSSGNAAQVCRTQSPDAKGITNPTLSCQHDDSFNWTFNHSLGRRDQIKN